jgi:RNA polymerase sigma factor (TIGR02999 family)
MSPQSRRASDDLLPRLYEELRALARARMARERPGLTLQPTALVHEAYLRLGGPDSGLWDSTGHFYAAAARAMRRILIERARRVARGRHGGELRRVTLDGEVAGFEQDPADLLALDRALNGLALRDEEMARVVELRYFAGLSVVETAEALGMSTRSVNRAWTAARTWLFRELRG